MKTIAKLRIVSAVILTLIAFRAMAQQPAIQYFRAYDKRGINTFETKKDDSVVFDGLKIRFGAGFTQGYQNLSHSNKALATFSYTDPNATNYGKYTGVETAHGSGIFNITKSKPASPDILSIAGDPAVYGGYIGQLNGSPVKFTNPSALYQMAGGFPLAMANFNIDVQLADGVRLNLVSYMSSHHHNEFWVKGGYLQIDKVGFLNSEFMNKLWKNLTLKVGHMEINYGDAHFRRSDGGNTFWNPWIDNNIMDQFTTEIGGELYWQKNGFLLMAAYTDGEIQGNVYSPTVVGSSKRKPSIYGKVGYDKQFSDNFRARLTGSVYTTKSSISNTLYGGDRTGSNYQYVMEAANPAPTLTGNAFSGRFNPGFRDNVTAFMINPFVKYSGLEIFGTIEYAKGRNSLENGEGNTWNSGQALKVDNRKATQYSFEALYRFGKTENFYLGARYNKVTATIPFGQTAAAQGTNSDITIDRTSVGAGWFVTRNIMLKGEYVNQNYAGYPNTDRFYKGNFKGFVIQGSIAF